MILRACGRFLFECPAFRFGGVSGRFVLRAGPGGIDPAGVPLHGCPQGGFARVHGRQGGEDIAQVVSRVDLLFAAGLDEAVEDGAVLPGVARSEKQPVFFLCGAPHKKNYAEPVIMLSHEKLAA
jgi:hypothetical protein